MLLTVSTLPIACVCCQRSARVGCVCFSLVGAAAGMGQLLEP